MKFFGNAATMPTQTNADRIRSMSDEELAAWLGEHLDCSACPVGLACVHNNGCPGSLVEWLKQPAETPTNADRCVCCGEIIPEGRQVCPNCLATGKKGKDYGRENIE